MYTVCTCVLISKKIRAIQQCWLISKQEVTSAENGLLHGTARVLWQRSVLAVVVTTVAGEVIVIAIIYHDRMYTVRLLVKL